MARAAQEWSLPLDPAISHAVEVLRAGGIETFESCQGGEGHAFHEPTIRFHGGPHEGFRALAVALARGLPVAEVRRYWQVVDGEPCGPHWEMTFHAGERLSGAHTSTRSVSLAG